MNNEYLHIIILGEKSEFHLRFSGSWDPLSVCHPKKKFIFGDINVTIHK